MTVHKSLKANSDLEKVTRCRVCAKFIRSGADYMTVYHCGSHYRVCCASCAAKFEVSPQLYIAAH